ncbi:MAG: metalloregulator ArsR/SmtB family transcription factor [Rhizobiaceae bacterium]|nr:metalloregulator ArsR/SmtB family transcription factor [Rhizobiaceae bacterium]
MRAAGEPTRLRLLALLDKLDLTVSDLIAILDQSQPRISRHLKLLVEAGLAERFQEGAWAYFRTVDNGPVRRFLDGVLKPISSDDAVVVEDEEKLADIRALRAQRAADYFAANAEDWGKIRSLHVAEDQVEAAMLDMALSQNPSSLLDLGTGTGRILQLFAPHVERGLGIDTSRDMQSVARSTLAGDAIQHLQVRHLDVYKLADGERYDLVTLHQVLHFLEDPSLALRHAKQRLSRDGHLLIVDFAPHDLEFLREQHAHRRLGMATQQVERWLALAGLKLVETRMLKPPSSDDTALTVALWMATHADDEGFQVVDGF